MLGPSHVVVLLEKIAEELHDEKDRTILRQYIERIRKTAYAEVASLLW